MSSRYFRCDWRHHHDDEPVRILYEVSPDDRVTRLIDVFGDGRAACSAIADFAGKENELKGIDSLVEGSFLDNLAQMPLGVPQVSDAETITLSETAADEFVFLWTRHRTAPA